jgi:hypothetical protein
LYALGRSAAETRRLQLQGWVYGSQTEHLLRAAGITAGCGWWMSGAAPVT